MYDSSGEKKRGICELKRLIPLTRNFFSCFLADARNEAPQSRFVNSSLQNPDLKELNQMNRNITKLERKREREREWGETARKGVQLHNTPQEKLTGREAQWRTERWGRMEREEEEEKEEEETQEVDEVKYHLG